MKELNKSDVMKRIILIMCCFLSVFAWADDGRTTISLNGEWDFDQTELAFPPRKYTRKIPVPGLVHLARPKISQYEKFFKKPDGVELVEQFNFLERDYTPMYNWYKRKVFIDEKFKDEQLFLTIKKSQYVTRVFVNGHEVGASMECYTPMDFNITSAVKYGSDITRMLLAGRISVQKGQMDAIKAVELLMQRGIDTVLLTLVGQGETKEYLEYVKSYVKEHELEQKICILEHHDDLRELRRQCDIGLTCSKKEAFGRVTVENMLAKMLVIGANTGGTLEIVEDGYNGLLYEEGNPESLAGRIEYAMEHKMDMQILLDRGYLDSINRFSSTTLIESILNLYKKIIF